MSLAPSLARRRWLDDLQVRSGPLGRRLATAGFIGLLGWLVLVPLFRLQRLAFEDGGQAFSDVYGSPHIGEVLRVTVALAVGSLVIALVLGTWLAYAVTRLPRRLRFMRALPILPIVIPAVANVTGWSFLLSPRPGYVNALLRHLPWWDHLEAGPIDVYSTTWIIIITGFSLTSFVYLFASAGLQNINGELIEAAQVHGSTGLGAFFRVTLPLLRPALIYGAGIAFLLGLGQFTAPLLLGTNSGVEVLTTEMYKSVNQTPPRYELAAALGTPLVAVGLVVVAAQRLLLGDQTRFVTHRGLAFRSPGKPSYLAVAAVALYTVLATVLPLVGLGIVALSPYWSGDIDVSAFSLDNFREVLDQTSVQSGIRTSVVASAVAVVITIPIGFVISSILVARSRNRLVRTLIDMIVSLPLGIPAVVFGVAFLLTYTQGPFVLYGTRWVLILVYVTLMLPFATRVQLAGMLSLGTAYSEASRVSGSGVLRTNARVIVPLMRSSIAGAAALMFVLLSHEFAASLAVKSSTTRVMGAVLFDYYSNGYSYPEVACIALIMTLVTTIGVFVAILIGGSDVLGKL